MSFDEEASGGAARPKPVRPIVVTQEDEREFLAAMEQYKKRSGRLFPTCSEILEVLRGLGYAKRIWRPVDPLPASGAVPGGLEGAFREVNEDAATGHFCWFSRVETTAGS